MSLSIAAIRTMASRLAMVLLVVALCAGTAHAIDPLPFKDRAEEVRFQNLTKQLRCLVCQNQDLADSDADLAKDLRKQVFDMMQSGKSDAEIKQYLVARYNDFVLYDPPLKPGTWLLWFTPLALVLAGAFAVATILRRRAAQQAAAAPRVNTDPGDDW
jgi:cytochrome c-type biogenesis protein CcmH